MSDYWDDIIENAGDESLSEFSDKASSLIKLTNKEIQETIPAGVDYAKFAALMKVVNDSAKSNSEKAEQIRNISGFAEIAANLLTKLV
ncbi:MAG: hypothetical protein GY730_05320 [bacterium]|nr:hypothetical protein [bacterium]